jgi:cyclopropane fatty-acyl-phospholipid synthase-like methyltransferase
MNYKFAYSIGFHPWEDAERHTPFVEKITNIFEREENGKTAPFGKVLDIGCGSGVWSIFLAKRGWEVTGIDIVEKALQRAKQRVEKENVKVKFLKDDVTALKEVTTKFDLLLDTGTFHGLTHKQRKEMGREINNVASEHATILLLVWDPKWRGPLPRGASREEIELCFPDWMVTHIELAAEKPETIYKILKANEQWYRLCRKSAI